MENFALDFLLKRDLYIFFSHLQINWWHYHTPCLDLFADGVSMRYPPLTLHAPHLLIPDSEIRANKSYFFSQVIFSLFFLHLLFQFIRSVTCDVTGARSSIQEWGAEWKIADTFFQIKASLWCAGAVWLAREYHSLCTDVVFIVEC